jgi:hypothetical protein
MANKFNKPSQKSKKSQFSQDYNNNSDSEAGFRNKLSVVEGQSYTPPFDTLGFDQEKLFMDDVHRLRCAKLKHITNSYK